MLSSDGMITNLFNPWDISSFNQNSTIFKSLVCGSSDENLGIIIISWNEGTVNTSL